MKIYRVIIFLLMGVSFWAWADEKAPASCQPLPVQGESVIVHTKKPLVILLHNIGANDIWVTHPVANTGASAGWTSRLQSGKWSAMVLNKPSFEINCVESTPGHEQQGPCEGILAMCQWPSVKISSTEKGTYWAGENMNLSDLMSYIGGRGFSLPTLDNQ